MSVASPPSVARRSRAVKRIIEPGDTTPCAHCGERVKFQARLTRYRVICNVYEGDVWRRVEHFHLECYTEAGEPHGSPDTTHLKRVDIRHALQSSRR